MANKIQLKRGIAANIPALDVGEPAFTTDSRQVYIGSSVGNLNMADNLVEITWADLVALREAQKLVPGFYYRITDYACTTVTANTRSAGYNYDIIVTALTNNTLSADARACKNINDILFPTTTRFDRWKLRYCLENDTAQFAWADVTNGRGVVFGLIDEFNNEAFYDFRNIQFYKNSSWLWTFNIYTSTGTVYNNVIKANWRGSSGDIKALPFITLNYGCNNNIFDANNTNITISADCDYNVFEGSCDNISLGPNCGHNYFSSISTATIGSNCAYNVFNGSSLTIGINSSNNKIATGCSAITLTDSCRYCTVGEYSNNIVLGSNNNTVSFGPSCTYISTSMYFYNVTFGAECKWLKLTETTPGAAKKRNLVIEGCLIGASDASRLELYDSIIGDSTRTFQINYKKDAAGKFVMLWQASGLTMAGKYKNSAYTSDWLSL